MWLFRTRRSTRRTSGDATEGLKIPTHLAVFMDGNGRWAAKRGLPRSAGHRAGAEKLEDLCSWCGELGVRYLTVYAFSTENWSRPEEEVHALMELFVEFFERFDPALEREGIRVRFAGDIAALPERIRTVVRRAESNSLDRSRMQLIIAMNYGGRREIAQAIRDIAQQVADGKLLPEEVDESTVSAHLYLPDVPDPDLVIRPSGELRLSNFLLWESAYSELWFDHVLWPDFTREDLLRAFQSFSSRNRRFGKVETP